jgi:glutamate dehydrogenase/leucine dehydrogenase
MLPIDATARKLIPIWTGVLLYFPDVMAAVAEVSRVGNDQHNPNQELHWAREKSTDQMNTAIRHMIDHSTGSAKDTDGTYHLAKAIWRLCAELQLYIEQEGQ